VAYRKGTQGMMQVDYEQRINFDRIAMEIRPGAKENDLQGVAAASAALWARNFQRFIS
jgi:hypothetical protein